MVITKDWLCRLILLAVLVTVAGGGVYLAHRYSQQKTLEQSLNDQLSRTHLAAKEIETLLNRMAAGIGMVARTGPLRQDGTIAPEFLESFAVNYPRNLLLGVYQQDNEGNILSDYPENWMNSIKIPVHLLPTITPEFNGPRLISKSPIPAIQLTQPLITTEPPTHLNALISLAALQQIIIDKQSTNSFIFILDNSGKVIFHPDSSRIGLAFTEVISLGGGMGFSETLAEIAHGETDSLLLPESLLGDFDPNPDDHDVILSFAPLNASGGKWRLAIATQPISLEAIGKSQFATMVLLLSGVCGIGVILFNPFLRQLDYHGARIREAGLAESLQTLQQQLSSAELRNQQLLDNAGDALFFVDPANGSIIDQNQVCEGMLGFTSAEITNLSLSVLFPGPQRRRYLRLMKKVIETGYGEDRQLQFRTKSGALFTGEVHARLGSLDKRQVVHGVIRDVTRLTRVEHELRQRNRDLTLINQIAFNATESKSLSEVLATIRAMVAAAFDADGGGIYLSRHHGNQLELVTHEGIPEPILKELKVLPPGEGLIGRAMSSGRPISSANIGKDRRIWSTAARNSDWSVLQSVPLGTRDKTIGVLFVFHRDQRIYTRDEVRLLQGIGKQVGATIAEANLMEDLTWQNRLTQATNRELQASRKLLRENLKQAQDATRTLERTEKMKNSFLALASHELRTPLTYVLSGSQFLLEQSEKGLSAAEQRKALTAVYQGGKRLEEIVGNLLEIARLEAQSIYLGIEDIDLKLLLDELSQTVHPALSNNQLSLRIKPLPRFGQLQGDREHLFRALQRLVENAIKFTPPSGEIVVSAESLTRQQVVQQRDKLQPFRKQFFQQELAPHYLRLNISDTGIGIDPEEHLRIFDKFYEIGEIKSHFTSQNQFGGKGVGLGLTLVKGMVEAHNGMVWVDSPGTHAGGSTFHLLLPLTIAQTDREEHNPPALQIVK